MLEGEFWPFQATPAPNGRARPERSQETSPDSSNWESSEMARTIRKLTAIDASYLYMETPEVPMHIGSMAIFQLPDNHREDFFEGLKAMIGRRLHLAPMLTWKLAHTPLDIDHPSWTEDEQFDIDRHIFRGALPAPSDHATLQRIVGWLHAKLLNRARPLWEVYVFDCLPDNQVAIYSKMHHACIDGGAGAAMAQLIYDASPSPREVDAPPHRKASQKDDERDFVSALVASSLEFWTSGERERLSASVEVPRTGKSDLASVLVDSAIQDLRQRSKFLARLPQVLKMASELGNKLIGAPGLDDLRKLVAPKTIINGSISSERSYAAVTLPMKRMKAIAAKSGTKLNDVVLAVSSGVLRGHLLEQGALPQKSLTAFVPVSIREAGDTSASNKVMGMICRLNTEIEDPKLRLEAIVADSAKSKELTSPFRQLAPLVEDSIVLGSPLGIQLFSLAYSRSNLPDLLPPAVNVAISNVPGPKVALYANGAELLHSYPVSIVTHGIGLNITLQSYRDHLDFGFTAAANILPNVQALADSMPIELNRLERACGLAAS
jgi:diacylglycerol O-acyltransferase / wax synthase